MNPAIPCRDTVCAEARARWQRAPADSLLLLFFDATGELILGLDVDEGTRHVDELFLRYLTTLVGDVSLAQVVVCVSHDDGKPRRVHRRLWHELTARLEPIPTRVTDLMVIGEDRCWSAAKASRAAA